MKHIGKEKKMTLKNKTNLIFISCLLHKFIAILEYLE